MSYDEELYTDIPPTKLRNRKEKFRKARLNPFWCWVADLFFYNMLENRFFGLRIKNKENFEKRNHNYANIAYAPHTNWWDGIVGYYVCKKGFKSSIRLMVEEANKFPLLTRAGAFPVNKRSAQTAIKAVNYAVEFMQSPGITLWSFPQGIVKPPNFRPIEFQAGMTYIANKAIKNGWGVNFIPVAVNYSFLREDKPEVLVDIGEPIVVDKDHPITDRKAFTKQLEKDFNELCDIQLNNIQTGQIKGYEFLYRQKLPWYKRLEKWLKRVPQTTPSLK